VPGVCGAGVRLVRLGTVTRALVAAVLGLTLSSSGATATKPVVAAPGLIAFAGDRYPKSPDDHDLYTVKGDGTGLRRLTQGRP
jgi:hypothetical protein